MLRQRTLVPEEMDRPDLPAELHEHALGGLARLNRWSGSDRIVWPPIRRLTDQVTDRPLRVLDVACGAGDVMVALARRARRAGIAIDFHAIDISATALDHARRRAAAAGVPVSFNCRDVWTGPLPGGFDAVVSSLFLHHLTVEDAIELLRRMAFATTRLLLVNDLRRTRRGWLLAAAACRLLTRSPVVHVDGPRSVAAAFTPAEALSLAGRAGLHGATVEGRWPFRYLLTWDRARS
jgi:2-polyprenyl-3-methyl-5-hydroxy-6-metoxy-1,4-benzoquinol methylase